jgi:hypothetical protein
MYVYETTYNLLLLDLTVTTIINSMVAVLETVNLFPLGIPFFCACLSYQISVSLEPAKSL